MSGFRKSGHNYTIFLCGYIVTVTNSYVMMTNCLFIPLNVCDINTLIVQIKICYFYILCQTNQSFTV